MRIAATTGRTGGEGARTVPASPGLARTVLGRLIVFAVVLVFAALLSAVAPPAAAGGGPVAVTAPECLAVAANAVVEARVAAEADPPGGSVRLFFRRLNPVGAFYYGVMVPVGGGVYRGVLPQPEDRDQEPLTDEWWGVLETRDWMQVEGRDRSWLEGWLADQPEEAAEVYAASYDRLGGLVKRSAVVLVPVRRDTPCGPPLDRREQGWADNLTVGETTELQMGRQPFHWRCDGIVVRISPDGILRGDETCRVCRIAERRSDGSDRMAAADLPPQN